MKRYSKSAILLLLLLYGTEYTTTNVSALAKKKKIHPSSTRTLNKSNNSIPTKSKLFTPKQYSDRRRVVPWLSIVVLVNILFFFRSFAAPFFDPLVSKKTFCISYVLLLVQLPFSHHYLSNHRENHVKQLLIQYTFHYLPSYTYG